jgi:hypothetical protein
VLRGVTLVIPVTSSGRVKGKFPVPTSSSLCTQPYSFTINKEFRIMKESLWCSVNNSTIKKIAGTWMYVPRSGGLIPVSKKNALNGPDMIVIAFI